MTEIFKMLILIALIIFVPYLFVLVVNDIKGVNEFIFSFHNWIIGMVGSLFFGVIKFEF